jgi:hypothetical protein
MVKVDIRNHNAVSVLIYLRRAEAKACVERDFDHPA